MRSKIISALTILFLCLAGCAEPGDTTVSHGMGSNAQLGNLKLLSVHVEAPNQPAYPPGGNARLWFVVVNEGQQTDSLVSVSSPAVSAVQLRWDQRCDGDLETVEQLPLQPAGVAPAPGDGVVAPFEPYFAQIQGFVNEVPAGTAVDLTFEFANAGRLVVGAPVQPHDAPRPERSWICPTPGIPPS